MNHTDILQNQINPSSKRKGVAGFFAAAAVALVGTPLALASVWSVNEVQSSWELTSCLSKVEAADSIDFDNAPADNFYIDFDSTTTNTDPDTGTAVLQETLSVRAPAGFRTFSTETFTVDADACGYDFTVRLQVDPTNSFGEAAVAGNWADKGVKLYLSEVAAPGDDFSVAADWDQSPLVVDSTGTVVNAVTGDAVLVDNSTLTVGFEFVGGAPAGAAGELNFQVVFVPVP